MSWWRWKHNSASETLFIHQVLMMIKVSSTISSLIHCPIFHFRVQHSLQRTYRGNEAAVFVHQQQNTWIGMQTTINSWIRYPSKHLWYKWTKKNLELGKMVFTQCPWIRNQFNQIAKNFNFFVVFSVFQIYGYTKKYYMVELTVSKVLHPFYVCQNWVNNCPGWYASSP